MKKSLGLLLAVLVLSGLIFGTTHYTKDDLKSFNFADIYMNGVKVLTKGNDFTDVKGNVLPSSISFMDTTYVPLRKLSEILDLDVQWDGSIRLSGGAVNGTTQTQVPLQKENLTYTNRLGIGNKPQGFKTLFIEDAKGAVVDGIVTQTIDDQLVLANAYKLNVGQKYTVTTLINDQLSKKEITLSQVTLNSFTNNGWAWEVVVPANSTKGYHHPFIIRIPRVTGTLVEDIKLMNKTLVVEGGNEHLTNNNDEVVSKTLGTYNGWYSSIIGNQGNYISMMSLFPRPAEDGLLYTHSLDRDTLFGTQSYLNSLGRGNLYRIDKQYDAMITETIRILKTMGKTVDQKVFLIGFSASSDFATRFNYTHPERAKAVLVNSAPTLPLTTYKGTTLNFPLGMADIQQVTGKPFDANKFKAVPQFWHTGDMDLNDGTYYTDGWGDYGNNRLHHNQEGVDYRKLFGDEIVARKALIEKVLKDAGFTNIVHKTYRGVEHGWNDEIMTDALAFLKKNE